jgi:hypothetical protein
LAALLCAICFFWSINTSAHKLIIIEDFYSHIFFLWVHKFYFKNCFGIFHTVMSYNVLSTILSYLSVILNL